MKSLSRVRHLVTPWTAAYQAPPSVGCSRQEYWSGVPLPSYHSIQEDKFYIEFFFSKRNHLSTGQWGEMGEFLYYLGMENTFITRTKNPAAIEGKD